MNTKTKKIFATIAIITISIANIWNVIAAQIWTWTVVGTSSFDSPIIWDDTIPGFATWSVSSIIINASVAPNLHMTISTWTINLWELDPVIYQTWWLDIEIWTNAVNWVNLTVRSSSGWLVNLADWSIVINDDLGTVTDGIADSYIYTSNILAADDSDFGDYIWSAALNAEVNDNTTEHIVYNTNRPEANSGVNDVRFTVAARVNNQTAAWNYQDTITFTVVGSF